MAKKIFTKINMFDIDQQIFMADENEDIKRILNGLTPYADIKIDDKEIMNNLDIIKDNINSSITIALIFFF